MISPSLPRLSIIGLGKLGAPAAAVFASKGYEVIGVDINKKTVAAINAGRAPVQETGLEKLVHANKNRLSAMTDVDKAVLASNASFIIVPTPSKKSGAFSNTHVLQAVTKIGKSLRGKKDRHIVVVCSTVMPGAMDEIIRLCLERASGLVVGKDVGLCYNPEFIALGSVIHDMLNPDIILIGESDRKSGDFLEALYKRVCESKPAFKRMNFVNAEIAKISINTFVTTKISYANMLANICDRLPNADCDIVTNAIGSDSRIGEKYLKGATGYGGPCFPRDNAAFAALAKKIHAKADLATATDSMNNYQPQRLMELIHRVAPQAKNISIVGLSYKPDTPVTDESPGIKLACLLQQNNYKLTVYDRIIGQAAAEILPRHIKIAASLGEASAGQDAIFVMVADDAYAKPDWLKAKKPKKSVIIIDCWRIFKNKRIPPHAVLVHPGQHTKAVS